jgi:nucleotide-binding universal stress UspA family protein
MFKTIVLALDGSDGSKAAIPFARDLAHRDDSKLVIAHVEEDVGGKGGGPIHATEDEIQPRFARSLRSSQTRAFTHSWSCPR